MKFEKIVSKTIEEKEKKKVTEKIERENIIDSWDRIHEEEIEKDKNDIEVINLWVDEINNYIKKLKIEKDFYIDENQIFFIADKSWFANGSFFGYFDNRSDTIFIDVQRKKYQIYKTLLHEMIHMSAYKAAHIKKEKSIINNKDELEIYATRTGYDLSGGKMNLFNEAITETITREIFNRNIRQIKRFVDFEENELKEKYENLSYKAEIEIFNIIIENIANTLNKDKEEIINIIKQGYFNGKMMHLRLIEKVYGKNFLNFLSDPEFIFENLNLDEDDIIEFFRITDKEKRKEYLKRKIFEKNNPEKAERLYKDIWKKIK